MEKYTEQKSKIKTVSIRRIYEWLSAFLLVIRKNFFENKNEFENDLQFEEYLKLINEYLSSISRVYSTYLHANEKKILTNRKDLCKKLQEACDGVSKILEFLQSKNVDLKKLGDYNDSLKNLKCDLKKIEKESEIGSFISSVYSKSNKKAEVEKNRKILINYSRNIVRNVGFSFIKCKKILDKFGLYYKECRYVKAIESMIGCWGKDYPTNKLQHVLTDKVYCNKLRFDLLKSAEKHELKNFYELTVLFGQWMARIPILLKEYSKYVNESISVPEKWTNEFEEYCGEIEDENKFKNSYNDLNSSIKLLISDFNGFLQKFDNYVVDFNKCLNSSN